MQRRCGARGPTPLPRRRHLLRGEDPEHVLPHGDGGLINQSSAGCLEDQVEHIQLLDCELHGHADVAVLPRVLLHDPGGINDASFDTNFLISFCTYHMNMLILIQS